MIESTTNSRAMASLVPTGPTATQVKDRAEKAGTVGPPPTAIIRVERPDTTRDSQSRDLVRTDEGGASRSEIMRSALQDQMRSQSKENTETDALNDQQRAQMAKAAYAETQFMTKRAEEVRAEKMRVVM